MNVCDRFQQISSELARLSKARDAALLEAFVELEAYSPVLAALVLQRVGDRQRAERWMSMHQRAFGGQSAYELLGDGDADAIWDALAVERIPDARQMRAGAAY